VAVNIQDIKLGLLLEQLEVISGQDATSKELDINIKLQGENAKELYQKAEIELNLGTGYWKLASQKTGQTKNLLFN